MKVAQVNVVAGSGSTGKIMADVHAELLRRGDVSLMCYGRKQGPDGGFKFCTEAEAVAQKILNRCGVLMYGGNQLATSRLIRRLRRERPDVVHLHCINGYCVNIYRLLRFLAREGVNTVVTHHGEFFYTGNCGHAMECRRFMDNPGCKGCPTPRAATGALMANRAATAWRRMRDDFAAFAPGKLVFTAVSPWTAERSATSPIVAGRECRVVLNGLNDAIFHRNDFSPVRHERPMVLHVTASFSDAPDTFKGGDTIVELARRMPDVDFTVAASYSTVSSELPPNLHLHGRTATQTELADLYRAADLTVIASKRETFSMIVAESLCCGTPIVGYKAGGPESIGIEPYAEFVDRSEGIAALETLVRRKLAERYDREAMSREAIAKYSTRAMTDGYIAVYKTFDI